ncbi:hydrophobe/amphiphile efflux-1 (HAE1) family protein [Hoeflea marina]|uniref:Hydrophobe/amphiphile efflux-1 (HAE1) family protein n=1 Tax=Hoeflea marina TaxID=274592 RepID=A0A317PWK8_9HYPH|nr:efflux RND transporter permease subunit [Hoeflea marina]PWW03860.1 hydrophobe/amphiphile efflux-1 (HAE1) family protein [Hoeflea marina]
MNMSTWAIRNPVPPLAMFLVLCVIGMVSFFQLPITRFPNIDLPIITVSVAQPGAAPLELTNQVTKPIEDAISSITGIRHVTSVANDSLVTVTIEFELETDSDRALNDVKDAMAGIRNDLPETISEPIIKRLDVTGQPIMTYAVSDPTRTIEDLSYFVDDVVTRQLQGVEGVGKVSRLGGADREIKVELEPDRLLALGITAADVNQQLRSKNIDLGGGRGDLAGQEFSIRTLGSADTLRALAATPIALSTGRTVRLDDLGAVIDGPAEVRSFAMFDGQPVVAFGILRATGKSDITAGENTKARLETLKQEYPSVRFSLIDDTTVYTEGNYASAMDTLYEGAILAVIVVFLFLRNWRATLITAVALPLSIIPTFFVMNWLGFSLNTVSLLGITLVTGILVDDAIVEIENIVRHIHMGKPAFEASEEAAGEIGLTVIAISFTIVAVFAPVSFMGGIAGQYFKQFGITVAVAVLFSLLVARLITPMMAAYFLKDAPGSEAGEDGRILGTYMRVLNWTLHNRVITLLLGLGIFVGSIFSATLLPTEFIPVTDEGRAVLSVELPPGSTIEDTRDVTRMLSQKVMTLPEVTNVFVDGGSSDITKANITVNFGTRDTREKSAQDLEKEIQALLAGTPDIRLNVVNENGQRDLSIVVLGDTIEAVTEASTELADQMAGLPSLKKVSTTASLSRPEIRITPKPVLAAQLGITATALASTIRIATIGDTDANLAKFNTGERQIPITVRMKEDVRKDLFKMSGQRIPSTGGKQIPLGVVADLSFSAGPSSINRYDRRYKSNVEADIRDGYVLGEAVTAVNELPLAKAMPEGTEIQSSGDAEIMGEVFSSFGLAMGAGILLVYVVLVLLFSSFITPITILLSLPLAVGGAIFALYLTNKAISLPVVIGFLMLMGIVTKNAIMLVEFAIEAMSQGSSKNEAMLDAGHKRARPIIMTTIAMIAGMVPSALAFGTGGEFRSPMAIAVIGGLLVSTMLSLLFVPSLFSVITAAKDGARRLLVTRLGANQPVEKT